MNKKTLNVLGFGFLIVSLVIIDLLLVRKNNELRQALNVAQTNQHNIVKPSDNNIESLEYSFETVNCIHNYKIWNLKKNTSLKDEISSTRLLVWISKNCCNSCLIDLFDDIGRKFSSESLQKLIVVKEFNETNNLDLTPFKIPFYYTKSDFLKNLEDYPEAQFMLMIINQSLGIRMVHIPISNDMVRTSEYLKLIRNNNVLSQSN